MKNVFFLELKVVSHFMFFMGLNVPGIGVRKAVWHLRKSFHMCGSTEGNYGLPIDNLNGCRNGQKWRRQHRYKCRCQLLSGYCYSNYDLSYNNFRKSRVLNKEKRAATIFKMALFSLFNPNDIISGDKFDSNNHLEIKGEYSQRPF